jgi:hypothetical protein
MTPVAESKDTATWCQPKEAPPEVGMLNDASPRSKYKSPFGTTAKLRRFWKRTPMLLKDSGCLLEKIRNRNDMVIAPFGRSSAFENSDRGEAKSVTP